MTVNQLIQRLKRYDPNLPVVFWTDSFMHESKEVAAVAKYTCIGHDGEILIPPSVYLCSAPKEARRFCDRDN